MGVPARRVLSDNPANRLKPSGGNSQDSDGIQMTAVDTGWITGEWPHFTKVRLMEEGFHAPRDLVDGWHGSTIRS
jgi:hypothetical protein